MSVEGCGAFSDEEQLSCLTDCSVQGNWNGHVMDVGGKGVNYLVKGYPMQGWGEIKHQIKPMKGSAGGSVEAKADSEEGSSVKGEVHVSIKDENGGKVSIQAEGSLKSDNDGNVKGEASVKVAVEKDF